MGFSVPLEKWFSIDGELQHMIRERILSSDSPLNDFFEPDNLEIYVNKITGNKIWMLLFLDEWLRQNKFSKVKTEVIPPCNYNKFDSFDPDTFVLAFIRQRLKFLFEKYDKVALFPGGKHTIWLLKNFRRELPPDKTIIFDDSLKAPETVTGYNFRRLRKILHYIATASFYHLTVLPRV